MSSAVEPFRQFPISSLPLKLTKERQNTCRRDFHFTYQADRLTSYKFERDMLMLFHLESYTL
jgi:hypothetical protein